MTVRKFLTVLILFSACSPVLAQSDRAAPAIKIDASKLENLAVVPIPGTGGRSPNGHQITVNNRYLMLDNKPWLPVMGEFHFSRYPEQYWEEELLKMKAGGVQIVATYLFWNHHEEIEGHVDWSGQRNLRGFLTLCAKHGLYVLLRLGPFSHGEVRNGGLPDWVLTQSATRENDPVYLASVRRYFAEIGRQVHGLLWEDGGPIIGLQLENEYYKRGPNAGAAHMAELKRIAHDSGMEAPLYTVTGWGNPDFPPDQFIPVFGDYPDEFWQSTLGELPPCECYLFERTSEMDATNPTSVTAKASRYPFFMAEAGGGMQVAYHRRPAISADDIAAMTVTHLGSGANLYGYYMYQGGSNPEGNLTTLQESEASDHVYDLPVVSYDFQAPLGEFGRMNPAFRATKSLHLFLHDFGSDLAPMISVLPAIVPSDPSDRVTPRVAARTDGNRGFIFLNNYQRTYPLPDQSSFQIELRLPSETITLPQAPIRVPSGAYGIWPMNLNFNGVLLKYATAQLLAKIRDGDTDYFVFFAHENIAAEFAFDSSTVASIKAEKALVSAARGQTLVTRRSPGTDVAFSVQSKHGKTTRIILLTEDQARNSWKASFAGRDVLVISPADVFFDETSVHLRARDLGQLYFSTLPALRRLKPSTNAQFRIEGRDGVFVKYSAIVQPKNVQVQWEKIREAAPSQPVKRDKYNAVAPTNADFERSAVWRITLPKAAMEGLSDLFLQITYRGDVGRLYVGQRLLADDFYNGRVWEIGLKRFAKEAFNQMLSLKVMPLRKDAPIYLPRDAWPHFPPNGEIADVQAIEAVPEYEVESMVGVK
jgi:hypothetical protein